MVMEVGRHRFHEIELSQIGRSLDVGQWRLIKDVEPVKLHDESSVGKSLGSSERNEISIDSHTALDAH